jgi:hypothetical protein
MRLVLQQDRNSNTFGHGAGCSGGIGLGQRLGFAVEQKKENAVELAAR